MKRTGEWKPDIKKMVKNQKRERNSNNTGTPTLITSY